MSEKSMIAIALILIASTIMVIVFREAQKKPVKLAVTLLCLPALLPNALLLLEYAVNPLTPTIKGEIRDTNNQPLYGLHIVTKYKSIYYTIVSNSDITRKISIGVTDDKGRFYIKAKFKPFPSALIPLYVERYELAEIIITTFKYKTVTYVVSDKFKCKQLRIQLHNIEEGNEFVQNVCDVYYRILGGEKEVSAERTAFLKEALTYFEAVESMKQLTKENCKRMYFLYLEIGDSAKASYYKDKVYKS